MELDEDEIPNETILFLATHSLLFGNQLYPYPRDVPGEEMFLMRDALFFMEPNDHTEIEREPPRTPEHLAQQVVLNQPRANCIGRYNKWGRLLTTAKFDPQRGAVWNWLRAYLVMRASMTGVWAGCVPFCDVDRMHDKAQSAIREALLKMLAFMSSAIMTIVPNLVKDDVFRGFKYEGDGVDAAEKRACRIIPGMEEEMKDMHLVDFPRIEHPYFYWLTASLDPSKGTGEFMIFETKCKRPPEHVKIPATHRPGMKPPHPAEPDKFYVDKCAGDPRGSGIYYHQVENQRYNVAALRKITKRNKKIPAFLNKYYMHDGHLEIVDVWHDPEWASKYLPHFARMLRYMHRLRRRHGVTPEIYLEKNAAWEKQLREAERRQRQAEEDEFMMNFMTDDEKKEIDRKRKREESRQDFENFFAGNKKIKK